MHVIIEYGPQRIRTQCTPATLLKDVRNEACQVLKIDPEPMLLLHDTRKLDMTLPVRLANIVSLACLTLSRRADAGPGETVRIKLILENQPPFSGTFPASAPVATVLGAAGLQSQCSVLLSGHKIDLCTSFAHNGIVGSAVLTAGSPRQVKKGSLGYKEPREGAPSVKSPNEPNTKEESPQNQPAQTESLTIQNQESTKTEWPNTRQYRVSNPQSVAVTDDPPDMSLSQFNNYYAHLRSQAAPRAMISSETKRKMQLEKRETQNTTVTIRMPDNSRIEGTFGPKETGAEVIEFVRSKLRKPSFAFSLVTFSPPLKLEPHQNLARDTDFGTRVLLVFQWDSKPGPPGPVLSEEVLALDPKYTPKLLEPQNAVAENQKNPNAVLSKFKKVIRLHKSNK